MRARCWLPAGGLDCPPSFRLQRRSDYRAFRPGDQHAYHTCAVPPCTSLCMLCNFARTSWKNRFFDLFRYVRLGHCSCSPQLALSPASYPVSHCYSIRLPGRVPMLPSFEVRCGGDVKGLPGLPTPLQLRASVSKDLQVIGPGQSAGLFQVGCSLVLRLPPHCGATDSYTELSCDPSS
jgi:hypothetical protein